MTAHIYVGYDLVVDAIRERSRVLDLGCGDGSLLSLLIDRKKISGFGVEISESGVSMCVEKGLYCYKGDIDEGLIDYRDNSFDYVICNQTLQSTKHPEYVLQEILRISRHAIISFPNFGYYKTRFHLLFKGQMPKNELLPFEWYESPNIHHLTIRDFTMLCGVKEYSIREEKHFTVRKDGSSRKACVFPNLGAQYGFFILNGEDISS